MWDGEEFRICGGDFVELEKNKRGKERYDYRSQPESWPMIQSMRLKSIPKVNSFIFLSKSFNNF